MNDQKIQNFKSFIKGLEIEKVWMKMIHTELLLENDTVPTQINISLQQNAEYKNLPDNKSIVSVTSHFEFYSLDGEKIAEITLLFNIAYLMETPLTEEIFSMFIEQLLPAHIWPYTRETIQNLTSRMNLPPLVLPIWKSPSIQSTSDPKTTSKTNTKKPSRAQTKKKR